MKSSPSIAVRAIMALVLMIGFYLLALAIAAGLLYIPYAEMVHAHRLHIKIALGCVIGAGAILWGILPRFDRFVAPGPELTAQNSPRLFSQLENVAAAVGQRMPAEVYLVPDVNAWVSERGGMMGFGSRRVMGLGLPLMRTITVPEFRAVLAHEFGHYHSGDTKLGPWIYKTRGAIVRTLETLGNAGSGLVQLPFLWYGKMFLRITHAVSRRQEFVADEVAARAIGARPLVNGLRSVHATGPAYGSFWSNEIVPVLSAGFMPPMAEGFARFIQAKPVAEALSKRIEEEIREGKVDPYDTHPPLKERIAAVEHLPPGDVTDASLAISLLENVSELERQLLVAMVGDKAVAPLKGVDWEKVGATVYIPMWRNLVTKNTAALRSVTADALPVSVAELKAFGGTVVTPDGQKPGDEQQTGLANAVLGAALTLLFVQEGWTVACEPGAAITVRKDSEEFEAFAVPHKLSSGELPLAQWQARCAALGLTGKSLLPAPSAEPPPVLAA